MKVKICPVCNTYNPTTAWNCKKPGCGRSLPDSTIIEIDDADYPTDEEINHPQVVPEASDSTIRIDDERGETLPEAIIGKGEKKRHGCLTSYLVLLIIGAVFGAMMMLILGSVIKQYYGDVTAFSSPLFIVWGIVGEIMQIVGAIALFRWKKWGFYLIALIPIVTIVVYLALGFTLYQTLPALLSIAFLYGVLHIGSEKNKAWPQLE